MLSRRSIAVTAFAAQMLAIADACAGQLRVEPVLLDIGAPAAAGTLTLRNDEDTETVVQTRVLRWSQSRGVETLEPTDDVVASPPAVKLAPHADYTVRIVRVSRQPVRGEESYRVVVDQLPRITSRQSRAVNLLIRQSIPVFFRSNQSTLPQISWDVRIDAGNVTVVASNAGDERLRIANLRVQDASGLSRSFGEGLVGYVLGQSTMNWTASKVPPGFGSRGPIVITAETNRGQARALVESPARR